MSKVPTNLLVVSYHAFGKCVKCLFLRFDYILHAIARRQGALPAHIDFARNRKRRAKQKNPFTLRPAVKQTALIEAMYSERKEP